MLASSSVHDSRTNAFAIGCRLHAYRPAVSQPIVAEGVGSSGLAVVHVLIPLD